MICTKVLASLEELSSKIIDLELNAATLREGSALVKDKTFIHLLSTLGFSVQNIEEGEPLYFAEIPSIYIELSIIDTPTIPYVDFCKNEHPILEIINHKLNTHVSQFIEKTTLKLNDIHIDQGEEPIDEMLTLRSVTLTLTLEKAILDKRANWMRYFR